MSLSNFIQTAVSNKKICCMAHVICGYPSREANIEILEEIERAGIEFVEIQFPFSEAIADGPIFTKANQQSLQNNTTVEDCFSLMKLARERFSFKIVMMGYYNTIFCYGESSFCQRLEECGAVGMIIPDLPLSESKTLKRHCQNHHIHFIPLIAPVTPEDDFKNILNDTAGFVYVVSRVGSTGSKTQFLEESRVYFEKVKQYSKTPIGVGFGIKSREDVEFLEGYVDIAIVGTAILRRYLNEGRKGVYTFLRSLRKT